MLDHVERRSTEGPFTLDDLVTGAEQGWSAEQPYDVHRETWTDHGPANGLLTAAMATAADAFVPLLGNGTANGAAANGAAPGGGGVLHLTVSGEGAELPMHRQFPLRDGSDPAEQIRDLEASTYLKPGTSPREVTVRLSGPSENGQDWDYRVTTRSDRSRELMLRHRRPEEEPVVEQSEAPQQEQEQAPQQEQADVQVKASEQADGQGGGGSSRADAVAARVAALRAFVGGLGTPPEVSA